MLLHAAGILNIVTIIHTSSTWDKKARQLASSSLELNFERICLESTDCIKSQFGYPKSRCIKQLNNPSKDHNSEHHPKHLHGAWHR